MALADIRANKVLERIVKESLEQGTLISASEVIEQYDAYIIENPLDEKHTDLREILLELREESSASKYNNAINSIYNDIEDGYDALLYLSEDRSLSFERWKAELAKLSNKAEELKSILQGLLLLKKDTAGYFDTIDEVLHNFDIIDINQTTATIDIVNHVATIASDLTGKIKVNLNKIESADVTFRALSRTGLVNYIETPGTVMINAFNDSDEVWQHQVIMSSYDTPVDTELKIKMSSSSISINRIEMEMHSSNVSSNIIMKAQYSIDNYNWTDIPFVNNPQTISDVAVFDFASIEATYIKFIMTKNGYDYVSGSNYTYEFGAKNISFYSRSYSSQDSELISEQLSVLDSSGNKKTINNISCEVCEILPEDTNIEYAISIDDGVSWSNITPANRLDTPYPKIIPVGSIESQESGTSVTLDLVTSFNYKNSGDKLLDYTIQKQSGDEIPTKYITIWRDVGQSDRTILTRESATGWQFDGSFYTTYIKIDNVNGMYIELGDTYAELDSQQVTGSVFLFAGTHKFKTSKLNWVELDPAFDPLDESEFKNGDPLYPYNHKLLVEGFTYNVSYTDEKVYFGVDLYASYIMENVSLLDFNYNVKNADYTRYAVVVDDTLDTVSFLVKYNNNISDFSNELFYITYKSIQKDKTDIRFRATLKTEDIEVSPILAGYRIKVGD